MIKLLHCITDLSPDGAQRTLLRLVESLPSDGFQHRVVTLAAGGHLVERFKEIGVPVVPLGMKRGIPGVNGLLRLRSEIMRYKPDVIQGWMYHGNVAATIGAASTKASSRVVWNIRRALYDSREDKLLTRAVIKVGALLSSQPAKIIYCVRVAADQHEALGFDRSKRVLIPNGFDTSKFAPQIGARESLRTGIGVGSETPVVVIAGRYHPQKDFPTFVKSFQIVLQAVPGVRAVLVGRGVDENCEELKELIKKLKIEKNVHLLGERQDLPAILAGADLFCSSSINEGFSNVVSEAMASGLPCVATDAGASREIVEGIGVVVDRRDVQGLAEGMVSVLRKPLEERRAMGVTSRERIVDQYSLESMIRKYEELYRSIAGKGASTPAMAAAA